MNQQVDHLEAFGLTHGRAHMAKSKAFVLEVHGLTHVNQRLRVTEIRGCPALSNGDQIQVPADDLRRVLDCYPHLQVVSAPVEVDEGVSGYRLIKCAEADKAAAPAAADKEPAAPAADSKPAADTAPVAEKSMATDGAGKGENKSMAGKTKTK